MIVMPERQVFIPMGKPKTPQELLDKRLAILYKFLSKQRRRVPRESLIIDLKIKNEQNMERWVEEWLSKLKDKRILKLGRNDEYYISSRYIGPSGLTITYQEFYRKLVGVKPEREP